MVKIVGICRDGATINRGVPQESVLGPLLFNRFLNDLFHVKMSCEIANYADYNDLYYENQWYNTLKENGANSATTWFENNYMCTNPDKFQNIILNRDGMQSLAISAQDYTIVSNSSIKVLAVTLEDKLKFDKHISEMCTKASRQTNALKRVSQYLDKNCRIMIYNTFISSNFNYFPVSWMFCGKTNLNKLGKKLQESALRFVFHDTTQPPHMKIS